MGVLGRRVEGWRNDADNNDPSRRPTCITYTVFRGFPGMIKVRRLRDGNVGGEDGGNVA
ncbi:hypothetical protein WN55_03827 [Dufourea novaeangliae]|uniref:Uncharacterized protein n=1 Tax=Dufourea novaeangliae TaxID=178035 RepID=A0A154NWV4_DUFNO|nr:hypothetical protein WN55_03827 [Dufourea novaeangliae]